MTLNILIIIILSATLPSAVVYYVVTKLSANKTSAELDVSKETIVLESRAKAREILADAKNQAIRLKAETDEELRKSKSQLASQEKQLAISQSQLEEKEKQLASSTQSAKDIKESLEKKREEIDRLYREQKDKLEQVASLTKAEAREQLLEAVDHDLSKEKGKRIRQLEEELKSVAKLRSKEILLDAMRYDARDYVVEYSTSRVKLEDPEMKGRIIGKEGRNIKLFEELTGVELELDASPGTIIISCFDPIRRQIAKEALEHLLKDGRIQPSRIEDSVADATKNIEKTIQKEGDNLCHKVGVYDIPKDVINTLGRFKYRFSYGQNMTEHTLEVTRIGASLAHELGADVNIVKMGCLLHDIGKVISDEEGSHVDIGVDYLNKHGIPTDVVNCVAEHHEDRPFSSLESALVALADQISGARPGSRSEDYESYVKRMKDLEEAANSFDGVDKAFAVSAGREVRVYVKPDVVDDDSTALLAREIARKIELEQTYPGVVKVTAIRETRVSHTAK
ncbi:MAG: ribonuclease Y [Patescibacteria group bacterium]